MDEAISVSSGPSLTVQLAAFSGVGNGNQSRVKSPGVKVSLDESDD